MLIFIRLFRESYLFAIKAIIVNKLRTVLSLLGITIGIFAIITVFTLVDSMKSTIKKNIETLGDNVLYIQKWPWAFGSDYPWWKYMNRPIPKLAEMNELMKRSNAAEAATFMISAAKTVKYNSNSIEKATIICATHDYNKVMTLNLEDGRYFTAIESNSGKNVAIIGANIAQILYENTYPIGKNIKIFGRNLEVIGILKKEGKDMFGNTSDDQIFVPINWARNVIDINYEGFDPALAVKAKNMVSNEELKDELTGIMRSLRKLKPSADDDFSINEKSLLTKGFESIFDVLSIAGWIIGGFSLLVGGFGIANIMFVSVRERTNIIGIEKSLGAKRFFILFEFLFEAIFLCLIGGLVGLLLVYLISLLASSALDMDLTLTMGNIILGISVSAIIGLISGFIPAYIASRLDPVVAIRANG
jgi:putative ABC transport system permease protein